MTGRERGTRRGDHHDACLVVVTHGLQRAGEVGHQLEAHGVALLRTVERDAGDRPVALDQDVVAHVSILGLTFENTTTAPDPHIAPSATPPSESSANAPPLYTRLTATSTTAASSRGRQARGTTNRTGTSKRRGQRRVGRRVAVADQADPSARLPAARPTGGIDQRAASSAAPAPMRRGRRPPSPRRAGACATRAAPARSTERDPTGREPPDRAHRAVPALGPTEDPRRERDGRCPPPSRWPRAPSARRSDAALDDQCSLTRCSHRGFGLLFAGHELVQHGAGDTADDREDDEHPELLERITPSEERDAQAAGRVHRRVVDRDADEVDEREHQTDRDSREAGRELPVEDRSDRRR